MGNLLASKRKIKTESIDYERFALLDQYYNKNLVLLGDSTLDNLIWVPTKQDCIAEK